MSAVDALDFVEAFRVGGPQHQERRYYDFTINGRALRTMVNPGDNIGLFGWLSHDLEFEFALWLLLREPSQLPSGQVPLYICPECGDLGCQSLSVRVIEEPDRFVCRKRRSSSQRTSSFSPPEPAVAQVGVMQIEAHFGAEIVTSVFDMTSAHVRPYS